MGVEFRPFDAGEAGLPADGHPTGAAHPGAVHHQGVEAHDGRYVELFGGQGDEFHHDHRPDGYHAIEMFPVVHDELFQKVGHEPFVSFRSVVGGDVHVRGQGAELLFKQDEAFVLGADNDVGLNAPFGEPFVARRPLTCQ